jgi:hypothetical protein
MGEILRQFWQDFIGRAHGPFAFRLILQPLAASFLAMRAGLRDARAGRPAYGWAIITNSADRRDLVREGWKELARVFIVAVIVDLIYEVIVFHRIYPVQPLIVAAVLALLPYPLLRGLVNRILRRSRQIRGGPRAGMPAAGVVVVDPERKGHS